MADPRFFKKSGPFSLKDLAALSDCQLADGVDPLKLVYDVAALDNAADDQISFLDNRKYTDLFRASKAGAVIVHPSLADKGPAGAMLLLSKDPYRSYAKVARAFYPADRLEPFIAPTAVLDPAAAVPADCRVEAGAVIGAGAEIGHRCHIGPNAVIGHGVVLGDDCFIGAGATVQFSVIGKRVMIYPGARIGQDGFGFAMGPQGHLRVPQLGRVIIGDDVEVGANATIDRGAGPDTIIGAGSMIDNLVQIGHNVQLGRGCVIVAQVGISGSTKLGDFAAAGGQAGFAGHLSIGPGARVAAQAGVLRDVAPGETVGGTPAVPQMEWLRQSALLNKMVRQKK